jgi:hypothetical protein
VDRMPHCDRCIAHWTTRWWRPRDKAELALCDHHSREHGPTLTATGFQACTPVTSLGPVTADLATH